MAYYGIDLGTTYSTIAFIDEHGATNLIPNSYGNLTTPSVVYFETGNNIVVGEKAKEAAWFDPSRAVSFVKQQMCNRDWAFEIDGKSYDPMMISAFIIRLLIGDAKQLGHDVKDVVITCPPCFGEEERCRTRKAGQLVGLNVVAILDEPVAAAINYGLNGDAKGKNVIVYDLGGCTFDVTVVKIGDHTDRNEICVISTDGTHTLGGNDWDDRIVQYYLQEFANQIGSNIDLLSDVETAWELHIGAERDKMILTAKESVMRRIRYESEITRIELTRAKFGELTEDLLEETFVLTDRVIEDAKKKGIAEIDSFLLVGGSTRMPQVRERIHEKYGIEPAICPDGVVAKGAARYAAMLDTLG